MQVPASMTSAERTDGSSRHLVWWLAATALVAVALAHLAIQLATPSDGSRVPPGSYGLSTGGAAVDVLVPGRGLEMGDVVVAVAGHDVPALLEAVVAGRRLVEWPTAGARVPYLVRRDGELVTVDVRLDRYPLAAVARGNWGTIAFALVYLVVAGFAYARRPSVEATRPFFLSGAALLAATTWSFGLSIADIVGGWGFWLYQLGAVVGFMLFWTAGLHFALAFPTPHRLLRARGTVRALYLGPLLLSLLLGLLLLTSAEATATLATWGSVTNAYASVVLLAALLVFVGQYRSQHDAVARRRIAWVILAALVAGGGGLIGYLLPPFLGLAALHPNHVGLLVSLFPVAIAIAIVRHNLFDIDRLVSRALVWGGLSVAVTALYVAIVIGLGRALGADDDLWLSLLATALVAIGFQPLRERWQRAVDRRLYGDRGEPVRVLARLGERLEETAEPRRLLPTLVETVADALKLPYVAIVLEGEARPAAEFGRPLPIALELPLTAEGIPVGRLLVASRDPGEDLSGADRDLLTTIARQAGSAVHALRLTRDLQRSRGELVASREDERRRLRRDLHDGLGPTLAAMGLTLDAARNVLRRSPDDADALLARLGETVHGSVAEIRRLVHALRPPALDELGLVGALREAGRSLEAAGIVVELDAPATLPPLPAAVEVAVYRIAQEALTNALRHASATRCLLRIRVDERALSERALSERALVLRVQDDGRGIPLEARHGVGLASMRERASELGGSVRIAPGPGGGTLVEAVLPWEERQ
jgi:two-component system, NarL family, sensor kinase